MNKHFACPQGHRWEVPVDGNLALAVEAISCPECGAAAETISPTSSVVTNAPSQQTAPADDHASIALVCPACRKKLKVKAKSAGKKVKCPHCQKPVAVPSSPSSNADGDELKTLPPSNRPSATAGITMAAEKGGSSTEYDFLAASQQPDELGRLGPYRVLKVLGAGGMGVVFRAEDPQLQRLVALKAMLPSMASSGSAKERFLREARAAAAIKHDHIVGIYQVGEDRGSPFLAMEFLEGEPLDERLRRDKALPLAEVLRIGRETAEGLAAAHARGLVHRDIKPANIWLESREPRVESREPRVESREPKKGAPALDSRPSTLDSYRVKILDFGLARAVQEETHLTQQGAVIGTPAYMAPEQAGASDIDHRADLFSLGCVLYEMSTGERPFKGRDTMSILMALASHEPPPPSELNPEVPAALSDLTMRLLAKTPDQRPASAQEVVEALRDLEQRLPGKGERRVTSISASAEGKARKPLVLAGVLVALLALAGVAALFLFRVSTPEGDFYVEVKDDDVAIAVNKQGGLTLIDRNGKKYSILARKTAKLPAGDYDVVLADATGLEISGQTVTIKAKDSPAWVRVWFQKKDVAGVKDGPTAAAEPVGEVRRMLHPDTVKSVAYFADGKRVLTADAKGTLRVWQVHSGAEEASWDAPPAGGSAYVHVRCSPTDANVAFSLRSGALVIWDVAKQKPLHVCQVDGGLPMWGRGNFSPDGTLIAVGGTKLWVFDVATGKQIHVHEPRKTCRSPAFLGNDRILLGAIEHLKSFVLWDWRKEKVLHEYPGSAQVGTIATAPEGRWALSGHTDGKVWLWNMQDPTRPPLLLESHQAMAFTVAISADGRRGLSGGHDSIVLVHDLDQGKTICRFDVKAGLGGTPHVQDVAFSPDGRYAVTGSDRNFLQLWRLPEAEAAAIPAPVKPTPK